MEPRQRRRQTAVPYAPTDEERAALEILERRFRPDDPVRLRNEAQWELNRAFFSGFQYLNFDPLSRSLNYASSGDLRWKSRLPHNLCQAYIRQAVATIGGFRPRYKVRPSSTDPEDMQSASVAEKVVTHYWDDHRMSEKKWEILLWLKTCGNAFLAPCWDPEGGEPLRDTRSIETPDGPLEVEDLSYEGELVTDIVSPYHVFVDNYAENPRDLRWWVEARPFPIEWVEQHFPDKADQVPLGVNQGKQANSNRWFFQRTSTLGMDDQSSDLWKDWVTLRRMTELPSRDYPRGRYLIEANGVVLLDTDNPHPTHKLSLVWIRNEIIPGQLWGQGDMDNLLPLQKTYNRLQNKEIEHVVLTANAKILEHASNELPESALITEIGERVKWNGMQKPEWLAPPPLPNSIPDLKASILQDFDRVASTFGAERGQYQGKVSGKAYISLIEQGIQSKAPMVDRLAAGFTEWAKLVLEWVQDYVQEDRLIKIIGRGNQFDVMEFKGSDLRGNTDVTIDVDSMTPKSKAMALELLQILGPGQPWLNAADPDDRTRVWRMMGMEDDQKIVEDKLVDIREATIENSKMLLGEMIGGAKPYEDHDTHVFLHNQMRKGDEYKVAPPIIRELIDAHVQSHYQIAMPVAGVTVPMGMQGPAPEESSLEGEEPRPRGRGGQEQGAPPRQASSSPGLQPFS